MTSRSSSRQSRLAPDPRRDTSGDLRGYVAWPGEDDHDEAPREDQPVDRILTSLDRLGERIRALSATDAPAAPEPRGRRAEPPRRAPEPAHRPAPPARPVVREASAAGIELQRAIEQIARKRDALETGGRERPSRAPEPPARAPEPDRPRPALDRRDAGVLDDMRSELRDLRRSVDRIDGADHARTLRTLGDRVDALARTTVDARAVAALRDDVATLRETVMEAVSAAPLKALEANYDDIVRRLEQMRGAIDNPRTVADLVQRLGDIRRLIGQVPTESHILSITDRIDGLAARLEAAGDRSQLAEMEGQMAALATAVAGLDQRRTVDAIENGLSDLYGQLAGIEKRLGGLDAVDRWQENLDKQATLLSQLAQRTDQLPRVAHEMERQSASVDGLVRSVEALPRLASDLAAVRRSLDGDAAQATRGYELLASRIDDLAGRIERMAPSADLLADTGLADRLADIAGRLDRLDVAPGSPDLKALEHQFERLAATIESRVAAAAAVQPPPAPAGLPEGLMEALARIEDHLAATTPYDRFAELESRVVELTRALEGFERLAAPDVAGIEQAIGALRDEFSALAAPSTDGIERELRALADRFDGMVLPASVDPEAFARLEDRLADVAERLDARPDEAALLADALARFERTLADALDPGAIADHAVRAARSALPEREDDGTRDALFQVQRDLGVLQDDLRSAARRDRELLTAIGEAVERLASRETAPPAPARRVREPVEPEVARTARPVERTPVERPPVDRHLPEPAAETDADTWREIERTLSEGMGQRRRAGDPPVEAPSPEDDLELPRIFGRRDDVRPAPSGRVEPVISVADLPDAAPGFDLNKPLEPGSGKPVRVAAAAKPAAPAGRAGDAPPVEAPRAETSKADFIAAARRAAQAAGAEPPTGGRRSPVTPPPAAAATAGASAAVAPKAAKGRFALKLPPFIVSHKRQLAMGVVAVLVVVGATRIVANLLYAPEPAVVATETVVEDASGAPPAAPDLPPTAEASPAAPPEGPAATAGADPAPASEPGEVAVMPPGPATSFGAAPETPPTGTFEPSGSETAAAGTAASEAPAPEAPVPEAPRSATAPMPPEAVGSLALRQAAAAGNPIAQFEVAARLTEGRGVQQDLAEAAAWYRRAAESGLPPAQYRLGSLYEKGQGVARDPKSAAEWYTRSAEAGNAKSMHNLAVLHAEGGLGQPDYGTAARWFEQAADYGVRDSQYNLGILYARGLGVPRDLTASYKWFAIAAAAGDADSAKKRDDVAQVLDKDALARARLAVETWKQKTPAPAANEVVADDPAWMASPEQTAATVGSGDLVMQAQDLLARRGYDPGPADGKMGKRTRDAIAAFQKARGLPVTGAVDATLIQALAEQAI